MKKEKQIQVRDDSLERRVDVGASNVKKRVGSFARRQGGEVGRALAIAGLAAGLYVAETAEAKDKVDITLMAEFDDGTTKYNAQWNPVLTGVGKSSDGYALGEDIIVSPAPPTGIQFASTASGVPAGQRLFVDERPSVSSPIEIVKSWPVDLTGSPPFGLSGTAMISWPDLSGFSSVYSFSFKHWPSQARTGTPTADIDMRAFPDYTVSISGLGLEAFDYDLTIPEPSALAAFGIVGSLGFLRRRRDSKDDLCG